MSTGRHRDLGRLVAHIPARAGSKRVKSKNLRLLAGKPMIQYAIEAALAAEGIDELRVNTDSPELMALARSLGVAVHKREAHLASDTASGDDFTMDIIDKLSPDTLLMVSPVCPLVTAADITGAIGAFRGSDADTLITCTTTRMQTFREGEPVNIRTGEPLAPSQDNPEIEILNWAVTLWDAAVFRRNYEDHRGGYLGTNRLLHPIHPLHAVKVSYEEDFQLAEALLTARSLPGMETPAEPTYWTANQP